MALFIFFIVIFLVFCCCFFPNFKHEYNVLNKIINLFCRLRGSCEHVARICHHIIVKILQEVKMCLSLQGSKHGIFPLANINMSLTSFETSTSKKLKVGFKCHTTLGF